MITYLPGGRRRIDRVLDPANLRDLQSLSAEDLRARREEAQQEENEVSYVRRMLQGRLDLLRADQQRRARGEARGGTHTDAELVAALTQALAEGRQGTRSTRHVEVAPPPVEQQRRQAELAAADLRASDPSELDDTELAEVIGHLEDAERSVSATRRDVQAVLDALTEEMQRRVTEGTMAPDPSLA